MRCRGYWAPHLVLLVSLSLAAACGGSGGGSDASSDGGSQDTSSSQTDDSSESDEGSGGSGGGSGGSSGGTANSSPDAVIGVSPSHSLVDQDGDCQELFQLDGTGSGDLEDDAVGTPLTYAWASSRGPGIFSDPASATPTATVPWGTVQITLTVTDSDGASDDTSTALGVINATPEGLDQTASTSRDTPVVITLTGSDQEGHDLTFAIDTGPSTGSLGPVTPVAGNPVETAQATYTPDAGVAAIDGFTFTISDGCSTAAPLTVTVLVQTHEVSGTIVGWDDTPYPGVPVELRGTGSSAGDDYSTVTDAQGILTQPVPEGWAGDVLSTTAWRLDPGSHAVGPVAADLSGLDFQAFRNYYVDQHTAGADDAGPGTESLPFLTMRGPQNVLQPGDTVFVKAGHYVSALNRTVEAAHVGTAAHPITYMPYPGDRVILDANGGQDVFHVVGCEFLIVRGFEMTNGSRDACRIQDSSDCTFEDLIIYNYKGNSETSGIRCRLTCDRMTIQGNQVYDCTRGIAIENSQPKLSDIVVEDNYVHDIDGIGIGLRGTNDSEVRGNVVARCGVDGVTLIESTGAVLQSNLSFNHGPSFHPGGTGDGRGFVIGGENNDYTVTANLSFNNDGHGFDGVGTTFLHNLAYGNKGSGVLLTDDLTTWRLRNNLSRSNTGGDIMVNPAVAIDSDYNFWSDGVFPYPGDVVEGANSLDGDPLLLDPPAPGSALDALDPGFEVDPGEAGFGDASALFGLQTPDSPAIDEGEDQGGPFNGSDPDMGAYESP